MSDCRRCSDRSHQYRTLARRPVPLHLLSTHHVIHVSFLVSPYLTISSFSSLSTPPTSTLRTAAFGSYLCGNNLRGCLWYLVGLARLVGYFRHAKLIMNRSPATCPLTSSRLSCPGSERSPRGRTRSSWVRSCTGAVPPPSLSELPPCRIPSMPPRTVSTDSKK